MFVYVNGSSAEPFLTINGTILPDISIRLSQGVCIINTLLAGRAFDFHLRQINLNFFFKFSTGELILSVTSVIMFAYEQYIVQYKQCDENSAHTSCLFA